MVIPTTNTKVNGMLIQLDGGMAIHQVGMLIMGGKKLMDHGITLIRMDIWLQILRLMALR